MLQDGVTKPLLDLTLDWLTLDWRRAEPEVG